MRPARWRRRAVGLPLVALIVALIVALLAGCAGVPTAPTPTSDRGAASPGTSAPQPSPVTVRFEIDMRAEVAAGRFDPARDGLGLRGSLAPLAWQRAVPLQPIGDGRYAAELRFDRLPSGGQPLQYKVRIERPGQGGDDGWEQGRNHPLRLAAPAASQRIQVARAFNAEPATLPPSRVGTIDSLGVVGSAHVSPRRVEVWLPPGYAADPQRRHPVLYLHDGQNVFDDGAAGAEWQVDETAERLARAGEIEPPIIVAVASGRDRLADYTPTAALLPPARSGRPTPQRLGGGATAYARFLLEELKPQIDRRYRTRPEAVHTAVGGSSLGGLVSLWLALHHPEAFGAALVVSPSLWWDDGFAARDARVTGAAIPPARRPRLWLDMGGAEGEGALPAARALRAALQAAGWNGRQLAYLEVPDASHDEAAWAARVAGMLGFLYGRPAAAR